MELKNIKVSMMKIMKDYAEQKSKDWKSTEGEFKTKDGRRIKWKIEKIN